MSRPRATVVITTRNRADELCKALRSCQLQQDVDLQVLVFDDASEPPLAPIIAQEFPNVQVIRNDQPLGYIVLRNRGFRLAESDYVFSIDDDAYFTDARTVARAIDSFTQYPKAAAFALRYFEPTRSEQEGFMEELADGSPVRSFIGCSHVIRRQVALEMGGYRELFVHQGEERDLCLRMWARGYEVRYLTTPPIVHSPSPKRDFTRWDFFGIRNTLLFDTLNVGWTHLGYRLGADTWLLLRHSVPRRGWLTAVKWIGMGYAACVTYWGKREPVSAQKFRLYRSLPAAGPSRAPV